MVNINNDLQPLSYLVSNSSMNLNTQVQWCCYVLVTLCNYLLASLMARIMLILKIVVVSVGKITTLVYKV